MDPPSTNEFVVGAHLRQPLYQERDVALLIPFRDHDGNRRSGYPRAGAWRSRDQNFDEGKKSQRPQRRDKAIHEGAQDGNADRAEHTALDAHGFEIGEMQQIRDIAVGEPVDLWRTLPGIER